MNKKITIIVVALLLIGIGVWMFRSQRDHTSLSKGTVDINNSQLGTQNPQMGNNYAGTVSTTTSGQLEYINKNVGIKLIAPKGWHIGNDNLSEGTLQFFNYDENNASKGFETGMNKIEAGINTNNSYIVSESPVKSRITKEVVVAGQESVREDLELGTGLKIRAYFIPIPSQPGKYFGITIYGDQNNFSELDKVVQNISWINK